MLLLHTNSIFFHTFSYFLRCVFNANVMYLFYCSILGLFVVDSHITFFLGMKLLIYFRSMIN